MLENFRVKSENEYNALTPEEKGEYNALKRMFDAEQKRKSDEALKASIKDEVKAEFAEQLATAKAEAKAEAIAETEVKFQVIKDETDRKLEEAEKAFKRVDGLSIDQSVKSVEAQIFDGLDDDKLKELVTVKGKQIDLNDVNLTQKAPMATFAGSVATAVPAIVGPGHYRFYARDLMNVRSTPSNAVPFIQFTPDTDLDGIGSVAEGAQKPNFGYEGVSKTAPVVKIAGLLDVTDEMMDDVVGFRSWIAREAVLALRDVEDFKLYKGAGGANDIEGLWTSSSAAPLIAGIGGSYLEDVCSAITSIRKNRREATAVVVSPAKWMEIYLNKDDQNAYTYPVIFDTVRNILTLGGVPVVYSHVFDDDEGLIGDFARGAEIWQRKGISLAYADQHADNFGNNLITIRVEERLALTKYYEDGFYKLFETTT